MSSRNVKQSSDALDLLLSKIRSEALREITQSLRGDGAEQMLRSGLFERYNRSIDDCHLLERWVTGELIRMISSEL